MLGSITHILLEFVNGIKKIGGYSQSTITNNMCKSSLSYPYPMNKQ